MACESANMYQKLGCGRRKPDDPFFTAGDKVCCMLHREGIIDYEDEEIEIEKEVKKFPCSIPICKVVSNSLAEFEAHYNSCHRFICAECRKSLPSAHLLDLHLSEVHSSFFQVQAEKAPMYKCFVEVCDVVSLTPKERHNHCINVHKFPHDFRFEKGASKPGKAKNKDKNKVNQKKLEEDSSKQNASNIHKPLHTFSFGHAAAHGNMFVPRSLSIGKGANKQREGNGQSKKENDIKLEEMMDTLPPI